MSIRVTQREKSEGCRNNNHRACFAGLGKIVGEGNNNWMPQVSIQSLLF